MIQNIQTIQNINHGINHAIIQNHKNSPSVTLDLRLGHLWRLGLKSQPVGPISHASRTDALTEASYALLREPRRSFGLAAINGYG